MKIYSVNEFCEMVGKSREHVRLLQVNGKLPKRKTKSGSVYFLDEDIADYLGMTKAEFDKHKRYLGE